MIWIGYAILFAVFQLRYFSDIATPGDRRDRVRAISTALAINISAATVRFQRSVTNKQVRTIYRIIEFSLMVRYGIELEDKWLYILDATPTWVGVMALAAVSPFELPYAAMFRRRCGD